MSAEVTRVIEQPGKPLTDLGLIPDESTEETLRQTLEQIEAMEKEADSRVALVQLR